MSFSANEAVEKLQPISMARAAGTVSSAKLSEANVQNRCGGRTSC